MFKSVFTKYITAFMMITLISFVVLTSIITSLVNSYSINTKHNLLSQSAHTIVYYLKQQYATEPNMPFDVFMKRYYQDIKTKVDFMVMYTGDLRVIISDIAGNVFLLDDKSYLETSGQRGDISVSIMDKIRDTGESSMLDNLDGYFSTAHNTYAVPIKDSNNNAVGAVFACSSNAGMDELLDAMIKTVIMSSLWIMLAALVAVYFISEKIIGPLKEMSRAAKKFASGQFDIRVPVIGRDEIAELAVAFNNMAESLLKLEDMRRTFLANVSHDLRTPMTTISGFIDGIIEGAIPPEKHEYYLGVIATEVKRLSRLVSSLLDISRMQAGERKFNMVAFDLCELARQIIISFEKQIDAKKLDVDFQCDNDNLYAYADRDAIYQILYNICDNGVKFSHEGGKYQISITCAEKEKKLYVSVYNEGQGIPADDVPYIFERFYKSDKSRGLDKTGVGLGMYISKTIIDAHNEKIWVESEYDKYCKFTFTLPQVHNLEGTSGAVSHKEP